jgi:hypothetical protein
MRRHAGYPAQDPEPTQTSVGQVKRRAKRYIAREMFALLRAPSAPRSLDIHRGICDVMDIDGPGRAEGER